MRILYIINSFSWGGAEKLVYDLSLEMRGRAEFIGVVALYRNNDETERTMIGDLEGRGVATAIVGKRAGRDRLKTIRSVVRFSKRRQVDVIHGHCSVPMLFAKIAGKLLGIPVVCTIHSIRSYSRAREMLTSWMVQKYVSIGAAAETYMVDGLGIRKDKIVRIYNAVNTERFQAGRPDERFWEPYGGKPGEQVILNVARVHAAKNQICLARAVKGCLDQGCRNIRAYILGAYDENDPVYQKLMAYIHAENLEKTIVFLGMHRNIADFLTNADCFVLTSGYEGLSVAFLEAVVNGLPVITTDLPFVHELNDLAPCSITIAQNDSERLSQILAHRSYARQPAETVARFKEIFSMHRFVEQHWSLYREVLFPNEKSGNHTFE